MIPIPSATLYPIIQKAIPCVFTELGPAVHYTPVPPPPTHGSNQDAQASDHPTRGSDAVPGAQAALTECNLPRSGSLQPPAACDQHGHPQDGGQLPGQAGHWSVCDPADGRVLDGQLCAKQHKQSDNM